MVCAQPVRHRPGAASQYHPLLPTLRKFLGGGGAVQGGLAVRRLPLGKATSWTLKWTDSRSVIIFIFMYVFYKMGV